jgi:hypothetical protein
MNYLNFVRNLSIEHAPAITQQMKEEEKGIFDSEQALLDFEKGLEDEPEAMDQTTQDRIKMMMFPINWQEAQIERDVLFMGHQ